MLTNAHGCHVHFRRCANAGPAAVDSRDSLCQGILNVAHYWIELHPMPARPKSAKFLCICLRLASLLVL